MKQEYLRYLKSKNTVILTFTLVILGIISFIESYFDKLQWINQLNNPDPDLNIEATKNLVMNYKGMEFMKNFWYVSDFSVMYVVVLLLGIGIFLSSNAFIQKENGFGNLLVIRKSYKKYIKDILISQTLYIITINLIVMILLFTVACIIGGGIGPISLLDNSSTFISVLLNILQFAIITLFAILANAISLLMINYINNKYLLQAFPVIVFIFIPFIISSTLPTINPLFEFTLYFSSGCIKNSINYFYMGCKKSNVNIEILKFSLVFTIYFIIYLALRIKNKKKFTENYI